MPLYRAWDRSTAKSVDVFLANSSAVANRVRTCYGRSSLVVHPPVRTDFFTPGGSRGDYFLYVGRLTGYKKADLVVDAFRSLSHRLIVVGTGYLVRGLKTTASPNTQFLDCVNEVDLRGLYRAAIAFVFPAEEDFGICMAEAQACGTPVIGLNRGGAVDIVKHGETGWLIGDQTVEELLEAIEVVHREKWDTQQIASSADRFSASRFQAEVLHVASWAVSERRTGRSTPLLP